MNGIEGILAQIQQGGQDPYAQMNPEGMPPEGMPMGGMPPQGMPMQEMPPQLAPQQMPQQPMTGPLMEPPFDRMHQAYMGGAGIDSQMEESLSVTAEDIERYLMMFQGMGSSQDGIKTNEVTIKIRKSK